MIKVDQGGRHLPCSLSVEDDLKCEEDDWLGSMSDQDDFENLTLDCFSVGDQTLKDKDDPDHILTR